MDDQIVPPSHDWREDSPLIGTIAYIIEDGLDALHDITLEDVVLYSLMIVFLFLIAAIS